MVLQCDKFDKYWPTCTLGPELAAFHQFEDTTFFLFWYFSIIILISLLIYKKTRSGKSKIH